MRSAASGRQADGLPLGPPPPLRRSGSRPPVPPSGSPHTNDCLLRIMKKLSALALAGIALAAAGSLGVAQIREYTLPEMVGDAHGTIHGEIVSRNVFRVDDPVDGPELYFTTLKVKGVDLETGIATTTNVTFHGGFITEDEGVWNSEAPSADDVRIGNEIVLFYRWSGDMGGQVSGNQLVAAHGGLYRTVRGGGETVVLGRGKGYAVESNIKVDDLRAAIRQIKREQ